MFDVQKMQMARSSTCIVLEETAVKREVKQQNALLHFLTAFVQAYILLKTTKLLSLKVVG